MTSITIPDSITAIGDYAFYMCTSLSGITIPDSVISMGKSVFYSCSALTNITLPFIGSQAENAKYTNFGYIFGANNYNESYDSIEIFDSDYEDYKIINSYENDDYIPSSLTTVNITNTSVIEGYAFYGCSGLVNIIIPDTVTKIGQYAFKECSSLTEITIPESVSEIGTQAFVYCSSIESITVTEGNTSYKSIDGDLYSYDGETLIQYAIGKTAETVTFPEGLTSIGEYAFSQSNSLTSVAIPDGVISIGNYAFYNCALLASVIIDSNVTSWGYNVFSGTPLTSLTFSDKVTVIGNTVFSHCDLLSFVAIPNSVISIGDTAFVLCGSMTSVVIGSGVKSIGAWAFSDGFEDTIESVYYVGTAAEWTEISIGEENFASAKIYYYAEANTETDMGSYWYYNTNGEIVTWTVE